jgi:hypothetical protein
MPRLLDRTVSGDIDVPALCWADSWVIDQVRFVVFQEVFQFSDVVTLIYEPDGDDADGFDVRMITLPGDRRLLRDLADISASAFGEGGRLYRRCLDRSGA